MSHPESDIAPATRNRDHTSDSIRTDGRTNEEVSSASRSSLGPNAHASEEPDYIPFSFAVEQWIDILDAPSGKRWPVIRTGDREPIRWALRAVLLRDHYSCKFCGVDISMVDELRFELDHIVPWSAGGSDKSHNLRALCEPCNQRRSNFNDGTEQIRVLPVTWWCIHCWLDGMEFDDHHSAFWCRARSGQMLTCAYQAKAFGAVPRIRMDEAHLFAYCAHCRHNSYTEVVL